MEAYRFLKSLGRKRCATCIAPARSLSYYKVPIMRCWSLILENRNGIYVSFFFLFVHACWCCYKPQATLKQNSSDYWSFLTEQPCKKGSLTMIDFIAMMVKLEMGSCSGISLSSERISEE
jgi:hypothetical protein